jgi:ectoine hydroxylase
MPLFRVPSEPGRLESPGAYRLDADERVELASTGYVVREGVLDVAELERVRSSCEDLVARLVARAPTTPKIPAGSYCFQADPGLCTIVKWEPEHLDVVQGVEPFAHFDAGLRAFGLDPRFTDPMLDLLGVDGVSLFTEKLNVKRGGVGGPIVLHQDYPYWVANSENAAEIATAVLFLDDTTRENGCLEVLPGSHRDGPREGGGGIGFGAFEMDPAAVPEAALVSLEVPAGTVVFFGSLLVHRSAPNTSAGDRRTLLFSYQPAGRAPSVAALAKLLGSRL